MVIMSHTAFMRELIWEHRVHQDCNCLIFDSLESIIHIG